MSGAEDEVDAEATDVVDSTSSLSGSTFNSPPASSSADGSPLPLLILYAIPGVGNGVGAGSNSQREVENTTSTQQHVVVLAKAF